MGNLETYGKWLVIAGVALVLIGAVLWLLGKFTDLGNTTRHAAPSGVGIYLRGAGAGFHCGQHSTDDHVKSSAQDAEQITEFINHN